MEIDVRPAAEGDLEEILEVYNHYVESSPATFEVRRVEVEERRPWFHEHTLDGPYRLMVAVDGSGALRGWASSGPFRPRAAYATTVEVSVYCRPDSVGHGVGSRLYAALFASLQDQDLERFVAGVALPNAPSVALHRRFGFRQVGVFTRIGRKFDRYWDVAWFERPARPDALSNRGAQPKAPGSPRGSDPVERAGAPRATTGAPTPGTVRSGATRVPTPSSLPQSP